MTAPIGWARWLGSVTILVALPACAPAIESTHAAAKPQTQASSDTSASNEVIDPGDDTGPPADALAHDVPADAGGSDTSMPTKAIDVEPSAEASDDAFVDVTETADVQDDAGGDVTSLSDVPDAIALVDSLADGGSADVGGMGDASVDAGPSDDADANPWLNKDNWPLHAVAIVSPCELMPPPFSTGGASVFCRADWEVCTLGLHAMHAPCGWIRCCNMSNGGKPGPGCPASVSTYSGFFPNMACPPLLDQAAYVAALIPNPIGKQSTCCPKFLFKWP